MAYIEKITQSSGKVTYRVRVRQKGAPHTSRSFPTRKEAVEFGRREEAGIRAGRYFEREEAKERTFAEFIDRYVEKELPKKKDARKQKMQLLWWKEQLGKYFLCHISPSMIAEKRDYLRSGNTRYDTPRTNSTVNRYLAALSSAYTTCARDWQWVKENPVQRISKLKENKGRERYLNKEEVRRLLDACRSSKSPHLYAIVFFALATGSRKGEILRLKWADINFEHSTATFRDTKNGETRTVYLNEQVIHCLRTEQNKRTTLSEYVFPNTDGTKPADIKGGWERAVKRAGLNDIVFHTLRHTTISHLAMAGNSSLQISAISGHKTLSQLKRYLHIATSSTVSALDRLNDEILGDISSG